jgi:hypothetical protein
MCTADRLVFVAGVPMTESIVAGCVLLTMLVCVAVCYCPGVLQEVDLAITADLGTLQRLPAIVGHGETSPAAVAGPVSSRAEYWCRWKCHRYHSSVHGRAPCCHGQGLVTAVPLLLTSTLPAAATRSSEWFGACSMPSCCCLHQAVSNPSVSGDSLANGWPPDTLPNR